MSKSASSSSSSSARPIQSAHQKGIILRDIKPSNVLVTRPDGVPVPNVIDFGIANATNQKPTEKTLFTQHAIKRAWRIPRLRPPEPHASHNQPDLVFESSGPSHGEDSHPVRALFAGDATV